MLMTFDFIFIAQYDKILMGQLREAVLSDSDVEICTELHRIQFDAHRQTVAIRPYSETSPFRHKIAPKEITYKAFEKMLDLDWDHFEADDIIDIDY